MFVFISSALNQRDKHSECFGELPRPFAQGCSVCRWDAGLAPPCPAPASMQSVASDPREGQVGEKNTEL